ncbi:hypothetical protein EDC01DRAFT_759104 [Geopyxis carbonaria]|nr:hypothetical protein EDC01DRAFT_759104 [Geopyxis carbonaria]
MLTTPTLYEREVHAVDRALFQRLSNIYHYRLNGAWRTVAPVEDVLTLTGANYPPDVSEWPASKMAKLVTNFSIHLSIYHENTPRDLECVASNLMFGFRGLVMDYYSYDDGVVRVTLIDSRRLVADLLDRMERELRMDTGKLEDVEILWVNHQDVRVASSTAHFRWPYFLMLAIMLVKYVCWMGFLGDPICRHC